MKSYKQAIFLLLLCLQIMACGANSSDGVAKLVNEEMGLMVAVPGGSFMMGPLNPIFQTGTNTPRHKVVLSSFYISRQNVSYGQFDQYSNLVHQELLEKKYKKLFFRQKNYPVPFATWQNADDYCHFLKEKTGIPFSLPTEAQWEYVARNQGKDNWYYATDTGKIKLNKNFPSWKMITSQPADKGDGTPAPLPVGSIPCTPLGVCGLNNSVNQWVNDWYDAGYYSHSETHNPEGPKMGHAKVIRSSGATDTYTFTNNYRRTPIQPEKSWAGFRCVINSELPMSQLKAEASKRIGS